MDRTQQNSVAYSDEADRLNSFKVSHTINNKKYSWRYTVIPADMLATLGYYYFPSPNKDNIIQADSIKCIYCNQATYGLKKCRSKSKDVLETISNVLEFHVAISPNNCLLCYLRLKLLKDYRLNSNVSNWDNERFFNEPFTSKLLNNFKESFRNNSNRDQISDTSIETVSRAGLIKYDPSYTAFKEPLSSSEISKTAVVAFCIYNKRTIIIPQNLLESTSNNSMSVIELHFKTCNNGKCYFFKHLESINGVPKLSLSYLRTFYYDYGSVNSNSKIEENKDSLTRSSDSVIHHTEIFQTSPEHTPSNAIQISDKNGIHSDQAVNIHEDNKNNNIAPRKRKVENISPPKHHTRKLLRSSPRRISPTEFSFAENSKNNSEEDEVPKEVTIDFKSHVDRRAKQLKRSNKLLDNDDGESDVFSFSAHGHSTFDIPAQTSIAAKSILMSPNKNENKNNNKAQPSPNDLSMMTTTPNILFSEKKVELLPERQTPKGLSSPDFVTALSVVSNAQGTPSKHINDSSNNSPKNSLRSNLKIDENLVNAGDKILAAARNKTEIKSSGTPSKSETTDAKSNNIESTPLTKSNLEQYINDISRKAKLSNVPTSVSLSSSSESSGSAGSISSTRHIVVLGISKHGRVLSITRNTSALHTLESPLNGIPPYSNIEDLPFTSPMKASSVSSLHPTHNTIDNIHLDEIPRTSIAVDMKKEDKNNVIVDKKLPVYNENTPSKMQHSEGTSKDVSSRAELVNSLETEENLQKIFNLVTIVDRDTNNVKKYFHNLLRYINYNNATLKDDTDGDLHFYLNRMPELEKKMTFINWVHYKTDLLNKSFDKRVRTKTNILKDTFETLIQKINLIDDNDNNEDEFLISICNSLEH
ncbi:similar to Saccharomyces cerevisiae YJR089W BIR1 Subunit of chromosomal passenger complex [Maudiozyma saulgeensis]|uniref:Similar to Saccharomyces cerevisiae YJR089W BIR1 Subunit of chromosomal passenger complex n=1 Tax=Maudiozyma saulgeensis TaxID=1789683 RepID=A0A1X7R3C2_9SACH|nr:similar to Saccharomyces cerevisiae YJR089W BIR1 Subunit of chromosomal passenger complex [Kazachstania saulgeensis]